MYVMVFREPVVKDRVLRRASLTATPTCLDPRGRPEASANGTQSVDDAARRRAHRCGHLDRQRASPTSGDQGVWTKNPRPSRLRRPVLRGRSRGAASSPGRAAWRGSTTSRRAQRRPPPWSSSSARQAPHVVTQNVDGLHQAAGIDPDLVIEVHGTIRRVVCLCCGETAPTDEASTGSAQARTIRPAWTCGGILKSATISFGQSLVPEVIDRAYRRAEECRPAARRRLDAERVPRGHVVPIAEAQRRPRS